MIEQHILLMALWILYGVLHSLLAYPGFKNIVQRKTGNAFRFYRLSYSIFAMLTLLFLLWFQFSIESKMVFTSEIFRFGLSGILILPGVIIMCFCIQKYFYEISGIQALNKKDPVQPVLQQKGLHKYVRHPLYLGTLLFIWGLFLLLPYVSNLLSIIAITLYVLVGIRLEEKKLVAEYGSQYILYRKRVSMLLPGRGLGAKK